jgi:hypothetical protein
VTGLDPSPELLAAAARLAAAEGLGESEAVDLLRMDADEGTVEFRTEARGLAASAALPEPM